MNTESPTVPTEPYVTISGLWTYPLRDGETITVRRDGDIAVVTFEGAPAHDAIELITPKRTEPAR